MDRKITIIVVSLFISVALVGTFWGDILERANPSPPRLVDIELKRGTFSGPEDDGTYYVQGNLLSNCTVAFTYLLPKQGKLEVYELDAATYKALTDNDTRKNCSDELIEGTLKVQFDQELESLSIQVWSGKLSEDGANVYFRLLGTWQFFDNLSAVYVAPSPDKDYKLMTIKELEEIVQANGIHPVG
ncbi:MAG: hypothetical protein J7K48_02755 [Thermococcus sp.]|nr:hypothetical protein [Thermococcus sp.]